MFRRRLVVTVALLSLCAATTLKSVSLAPQVLLAVPDAWTAVRDTRTTIRLEHAAKPRGFDASMVVHVEKRPSHDDALRRLAVFHAADVTTAKYRLIAGWPALERKALVPFQHPGEGDDARIYRGSAERTYRTLTVVAIGTYVIRFDTLLQPGASAVLADEALAIAQRIAAPAADADRSARELRSLPNGGQAPAPVTVHASATIAHRKSGGTSRSPGGSSQQVGGAGEIEAAASLDGNGFVTNAACSTGFSTNGGASFTGSVVNWTGVPPGIDGDCTVTWGPSGNVYAGRLASSGNNQWIGIARSVDGGAHFNFLTLAVNRSAGQPGATNVDQPHITADRWNTAGGNDQLYVAWHETGNFVARVACSSNSGAAWGAPVDANSGNLGFPRVAVGSDGMVYVVSRTWPNQIDIDKYSSCSSGLVEQIGFPQSFAFADLFGWTCAGGAVPGLDRCNDGNTLASPTIAVDDTDPKHVYIGWAQANAANNGQNILVNDFRADGVGNVTFGTPVAANGGGNALRFMPWLGAWGGVAYVGWYDRRAAGSTVADPNDFTRYYRGSVMQRHGALVAGPEVDLMGVDDPQCASGWAGGTRELQDATQCTVQPQNAVGGSGLPKYGDYNGLAIGGGRLLNIWASGTAPSDLAPAANHAIRAYVSMTDLPSMFFVRDWTTNASAHDGGEEPSTNPDFYDTGDVWNQTTTTAAPIVNDWIVGDLPVRDAQSFAFTRVSRRAPAASTVGPTAVVADFLMADFGMNVPFVDLGQQTVTLNAADTTKISDGLAWTLPSGASSHVCLAVQINAPGDHFVLPGLLNRSPGPSGTDPDVVGDNKKAQRNLLLGSGGGGAGTEAYAIVRNAERVRRDIVVEVGLDARSARSMRGGSAGVVGADAMPLGKGRRIVLAAMAPGEERWIGLRFGSIAAPDGTVTIVRFRERGKRGVTNGFAIGYRRLPLANVVRERLRTGRDVLGRLAAIARDDRMLKSATVAGRLAGADPAGADAKTYRAFLTSRSTDVRAAVAKQLSAGGADPFAVGAAFATLSRALASGDDETVAIADDVALARLDAHLTWVQRQSNRAKPTR